LGKGAHLVCDKLDILARLHLEGSDGATSASEPGEEDKRGRVEMRERKREEEEMD
jgi:hypothetical protein